MSDAAESTLGILIVLTFVVIIGTIGYFMAKQNITDSCDRQGYFQTDGKTYSCKPAKTITTVVELPEKKS